MSHSDLPLFSEFKGLFSDGCTPKARQASVTISGGVISVRFIDALHEFSVEECHVSESLGSLPWTITFPDRSTLAVDASLDLPRLMGRPPSRLVEFERSYKWVFVSVAAIFAIAVGFWRFGIPVLADQIAFHLPLQTEELIGKRALEGMDSSGLFSPSGLPPTDQVKLAKALSAVPGIGLRADQIHFRNSKAVGANAFALPGGTIVITDALASALDTPELVAVASHEAGHIHYRHSIRLMLRGLGISVAMGSLVGHVDLTSTLITSIPSTLLSAKYSRDFEEQADMFGVSILEAAHLSPCALGSALKTLENFHKDSPNRGDGIAGWFSSHPGTKERIAMLGICSF